MRLTAPPLAPAALAAADRSWVRQVISFGEAPGTIGFCALLQSGMLRPAAGPAHGPALLAYDRLPDGTLGPVPLSHRDISGVLRRLELEAGMCERDVVLAAPPAGDGRSYTALLDHALLSGATIVAVRADDLAAAAQAHHPTALIAEEDVAADAPPGLRALTVAS